MAAGSTRSSIVMVESCGGAGSSFLSRKAADRRKHREDSGIGCRSQGEAPASCFLEHLEALPYLPFATSQ